MASESGSGRDEGRTFRVGEDETTAEFELLPQTSNGASDRAAELFVDHLAERERLTADRLREDIRTLRWHVNLLFAASMTAALIALGLCVGGVVMIVAGEAGAAAVSEAMSILTGVGTVGLRSMGNEVRAQRDVLIEEERESARLMRAVGLTLLIPDVEQRNNSLADLAARMAARLEADQLEDSPGEVRRWLGRPTTGRA